MRKAIVLAADVLRCAGVQDKRAEGGQGAGGWSPARAASAAVVDLIL